MEVCLVCNFICNGTPTIYFNADWETVGWGVSQNDTQDNSQNDTQNDTQGIIQITPRYTVHEKCLTRCKNSHFAIDIQSLSTRIMREKRYKDMPGQIKAVLRTWMLVGIRMGLPKYISRIIIGYCCENSIVDGVTVCADYLDYKIKTPSALDWCGLDLTRVCTEYKCKLQTECANCGFDLRCINDDSTLCRPKKCKYGVFQCTECNILNAIRTKYPLQHCTRYRCITRVCDICEGPIRPYPDYGNQNTDKALCMESGTSGYKTIKKICVTYNETVRKLNELCMVEITHPTPDHYYRIMIQISGDWNATQFAKFNTYVDLLRRLIKKNPGKWTLCM